MCYLLQSPATLSYAVYCSTIRQLIEPYPGSSLSMLIQRTPRPCNDMELHKKKAIWGTRAIWFRIVCTWEGQISDLPTIYTELFI